METAAGKQDKIARAMLMQLVQRRYLSARLSALNTLHFGFTFALAGATVFGVLQALYSILTVPHEYGHVLAARFVGHRVSKVQVDFLDKSGAFFRGLVDDTQEFVNDEPSSNNATSSSEQTENYAEDGRMGFVVYEPSIIWINTTSYQSVDAYNSFAEDTNQNSTATYSAITTLPVYVNATDAVAKAGTDSAAPVQVLINDTHYLEITASATEFEFRDIDGVQQAVASEAVVDVAQYYDISNAAGRALGTQGIVAVRAMGGPSMEMTVICTVLMAGATCCAFGYTIWGTLFTSLGVLMDGLTVDYVFMSAFSGEAGDYRKAADALHALAGWDAQAILVQWALSYVLVPIIAFCMTYWILRSLRLRRLPVAHTVRMLCNLDWARSALRRHGSSTGGHADDAGDRGTNQKPESTHVKRAMAMSRRETAVQAPGRLISSVAKVVATVMAAPGPGSRAKSAVASSPLFPPGGRSSPPSPLRAGASHEMASEALTGATQASAAASTALRDASTAADAVKAMGSVRRPIVRLMRRYHRCLSAALADVRGTRRLLRRARRVAIAETRAPQRHWVERMVTACGTVARLPDLDPSAEGYDAQWLAADASWATVCGGTSRMFRSLHQILVAAGGDRHRRAVAAWMVRRWLLILSIRGALIMGPFPHWWPLLHAGIITIAALSRLCHLSGTRPAVGAPAENGECARLTSDLAAAAVVLNVLPAAVALRALHVWPWHRTPLAPARVAAGGPAAKYVSDSQPPALVLARRRGLRDPPPVRCMQDALDAHRSASIESLTRPGGVADHAKAHSGEPVAEGSEGLSSRSIPGSRGVRWPLVGPDGPAARSSTDITTGSSSSSGTPAVRPPLPAAALRSHPVDVTRTPSGPQPQPPRTRSAGGAAMPQAVPEDSAVYHIDIGNPAGRPSPKGKAREHGRGSPDPLQQRHPSAAAALGTAAHMTVVPSGDMGLINAVAQIGRLESCDMNKDTLSMFAFPWAAVSEAERDEGPALRARLRPTQPSTEGGLPAAAEVARAEASQSGMGEAFRRSRSLGEAVEVPADGEGKRASWWGREGGAAATAFQRGAEAVRATVRFAKGAEADGSESDNDEGIGEMSGGSIGQSGDRRVHRVKVQQHVAEGGAAVSDMAVMCGWAAKLEGAHPWALRRVTAAPRRIQIAWFTCNVASAVLCACVGALEGWAQLQLCCIASLWLAGTTTLLEYLMACIVSSTTEMHLAAMHTHGWGAKCARVHRYFQLRRQAASRGLSAAEAAALHGLVLDQRALEWWFRMMQTASDVGFLTPQQLCALGRVEQARGDPNAWQPLENSNTGMASKALDTRDATANTSATRWVFSAAAGSPDKHSGALGATDIILDVPMHVAAAGGRRGSRSGGARRTGDDAECGGVWSGAGEEPAPALAAVDDGIDSSSDGSGSMSSGGLECAAQRAIEHAAVAGDDDDDDDDDEVIDGDSEEAEITAALFVDELINTFDGGGETAQRRVPDSIAGFSSLLRQNGVRRTVWLSMAHLVDGVVGAVMDDADVAREAAASVAVGVRTTAAAGRATIATIATRSTELRQSLRRTAHRATMRRNMARRASGSPRRSRKA